MHVDEGSTYKHRQDATDRLLAQLKLTVSKQKRHDVGSCVHIFSHIRMTMHVEHLQVSPSCLLPVSHFNEQCGSGGLPVCRLSASRKVCHLQPLK